MLAAESKQNCAAADLTNAAALTKAQGYIIRGTASRTLLRGPARAAGGQSSLKDTTWI